MLPLVACAIYSTIAFLACHRLLGNTNIHQAFIKNGLFGKDLGKLSQPIIPESMGLVCGLIYLVSTFLFIPVPFLLPEWDRLPQAIEELPLGRLSTYLSALLSLTCMILLGFADDVLDLRWRVKLHLPTIASVPLLMVYAVTSGITSVVVPVMLRPWLGRLLDLGPLYYVYMGMLAVFCTNSINILSGINGLESGQALVIALSLTANSLLYVLPQLNWLVDGASLSRQSVETHSFSLYLLMPFVAVTSALFLWNRYPARVFVGDVFCYFAGMTFAVVGILGHYSKTLLLFFIPQVLNFIISFPQLSRMVPCPRHRLPRFDSGTGLLYPSMTPLRDASSGWRGRLAESVVLPLLATFRLIQLECKRDVTDQRGKIKQQQAGDKFDALRVVTSVAEATHTSNLTLPNVVLVLFGPMSEKALCNTLIFIQFMCSLLAFSIRYGLVQFAYP